jgi:hypothetical protein
VTSRHPLSCRHVLTQSPRHTSEAEGNQSPLFEQRGTAVVDRFSTPGGLRDPMRRGIFDEAGLRYLVCNVRIRHLTLFIDGSSALCPVQRGEWLCAWHRLHDIASKVSHFSEINPGKYVSG